MINFVLRLVFMTMIMAATKPDLLWFTVSAIGVIGYCECYKYFYDKENN